MKSILFYILLLPLAVNGQIITTIAGCSDDVYHWGHSGDGGPATYAKLALPEGLCIDKFNNIYIADGGNSRVRKIDALTGIITTVAGLDSFTVSAVAIHGFFGDLGPATNARLYLPCAVFTDTTGNVYIADAGNNRIRKITIATGIITTIAGSGPTGIDSGSAIGDGGMATNAQLNAPSGLCLDKYGDIYIADSYNNKIRKIDTRTGIINTVAGNGLSGYYGDNGPATNAELCHPEQVFVDTIGNIFICDYDNNAVRKVEAATNIIRTIAGTGVAGFFGDNGPATNAQLSLPLGIYVDSFENIYIADYGNGSIRKIDGMTGIITTVAGIGTSGLSGDNGPATNAQLQCGDVFLDNMGNIIIADFDNNRIRKVSVHTVGISGNEGAIGNIDDPHQYYQLYPNPNNGIITLEQRLLDILPINIEVYNATGERIETLPITFTGYTNKVNLGNMAPGLYLFHIINSNGHSFKLKFTIQ